MSSNNFVPDVVFALGGGGKEMAYHLLEQDWVLEEVVRPRAHRSEDLSVRVLDTATDDANGDVARIEAIRDRRDTLLEEVHETGGTAGSVTVDHTLLTEGMQLLSATSLTGSQEVPAIAEANGMDPDDWWLQSGDIEENLNFAKGVYRRRALAKAAFYKARAERQEVRRTLDLAEPGRVAIFVGLGGGSGSGILFDVVEHLHENCPSAELTVFGVLPSATEDSEGVHENAYAALCELERMRLSDDDPLNDVVLYPIDATGYQGKDGDRLATADALSEFDEAFCQSVLAYYGAEGEDQFNRTPSFAPFTVAVPQVLEYNVASIEEARDHLTQRVDALVEGFEAERDLVDRVREFYADAGVPAADDRDLPEEDREYLRDRLTFLEAIAEEELFIELEYVSADDFRDALADAREEVGDDDVVALIERLSRYVGALSTTERRAFDDLDTQLATALHDGVVRLEERAELLDRKEAIGDGTLRAKVGTVLRTSPDGHREVENALAELAAARQERESRRRDLEGHIEDVEANLEAARAEHERRVAETVEAFERETAAERRALGAHDLDEAETALQDLERALEAFVRNVEQARDEGDLASIDDSDVEDALDAVAAYEERVAVDALDDFTVVDKGAVTESMDTLVDLRRTALDANSTSGFLDRLPLVSNTDQRAGAAKDRYRGLKENLDDRVFTVSPATTDFQAILRFDAADRLESVADRVDDLERRTLDVLDQVAPTDLSPDARRRVETALGSGSVTESVRTAVSEALPSPTSDENLDALKSEAEALGETCDRYEAAEQAFEDVLAGPLSRWRDARDRAATAAEAHEAVGRSLGTDESFGFKRTVQPSNVVATARKDDLGDAGLLSDPEEHAAFARHLEPLLKNVTDTDYHGLVTRRVTGRETNYYGTDVNVGIVAPTDGFDPTDHDLTSRLARAFVTQGPGPTTDSVGTYQLMDESGQPVGAPWQFGLTAFISGVFLDNLRAAAERPRRSTQSNRAPHLHHAYRLEDGVVVERERHVNLNDTAARELYVGADDGEVRRTLLEEYGTVSPTDEVRSRSDSDVSASVERTEDAVPDSGRDGGA